MDARTALHQALQREAQRIRKETMAALPAMVARHNTTDTHPLVVLTEGQTEAIASLHRTLHLIEAKSIIVSALLRASVEALRKSRGPDL